MRRWISVILIVCAITAAAFAWQVGVFAAADDMGGHAMGIECLAHCLTAGADEADVAATISTVVSVVATALFLTNARIPTVLPMGTGKLVGNAGDPRLRRSVERRD